MKKTTRKRIPMGYREKRSEVIRRRDRVGKNRRKMSLHDFIGRAWIGLGESECFSWNFQKIRVCSEKNLHFGEFMIHFFINLF